MPPAVVGVPLPEDQAALLERVEQGNEPAGIDTQRSGDRSLRLADALGEDRQDAVVVKLEAGLLRGGDRLRLEAEAEPGQEETAARRKLLGDPRNGTEWCFSRHHGISVARKRCVLLPLHSSTIWENKR